MIIDTINRLPFYAAMNPYIGDVVDFIKKNNLADLTPGRHDINGENVYVNVCEPAAKTRQEAKMECHRQMIDIHVPLTADEEQGYHSAGHLSEQPYDEAGDCSMHPDECETYYTIHPGQFAIHFPGEGHSPAISENGLKKCIFKLKA